MSRDAHVGDDGGNHRHRQDGILTSVSIRDLDNPEPAIHHFLGPPISSIRRLSFATDGDGEGEIEDQETLLHRRRLVNEITREATTLVDEDIHNFHAEDSTATTHNGRVAGLREWPTKDITDGNIDDGYVEFILCCNPAVPDDSDTAELRRSFRAPPKCDGVTFSTFKLYQLIKRFDEGEIKTWIQLVTELGVERKQDQSTQKVQQYAVRLKRWMHAMHIDAFFEYCLDRPHIYYEEIPLNLPSLDYELRDGVPLEEDLALRALMPEYRPKRGRRKLERSILDSGYVGSEIPDKRSKKPLLPATLPNLLSHDEPSFMHYDENQHVFSREDRTREFENIHPEARLWPDIRIPNTQSLFPTIYPNPFEALHPMVPSGQQLRWRTSQKQFDSSSRHVALQRVRSAPAHQFPSLKRARRSHGPAVSSAWPSFGTSKGGKARGRPIGNRGAAETAYSTFPASPSSLEAQLSDQGIDLSLGADLPSTPTAIEEQLQFSSDAHQTILPPIIQALQDSIYDNNIEIPPLLERDDLRNDLHAHSFNPYGALERVGMIKEQLATHISLLGRPQDNTSIETARAIANSLVDDIVQASHEKGTEATVLRQLSLLLGLDALDMQDVAITKITGGHDSISDVQQIQKEMSLFERYQGTDDEGHSIHDLLNTDDTAESPQTIQANVEQEPEDAGSSLATERYDLSWKLKLGPIEASVSALVTLANNHNRPSTSREEQRLREEVEMLLSDMGTANPSPGSFPGSASDLLLNDEMEPPLEGSVDWRSKYFEAEEKLHKVEEELARLKQDLIARVMS
ncbi:hypothetical protein TWF694_003955 [Orbilia ellipsospora]|uniref:Uncharacterized protein n=1 Tax=Orbilia ellipsospora TaxID=2528407 RepID=A0AAV9WWH5_9PEZI